MRRIWAGVICVWLVLGVAGAQDVYLEVGEARLFFLPEGSEALSVRVSAPKDSPLYFRLDHLPEVELDLGLSDLEGSVMPFSSRQEGDSTFVEVPVGGDYLLSLQSSNTYLRLEYGLEPFEAPLVGENQAPFYEPMTLTFEEFFEDNARNWWTGETDTTTTKIVDGVLSMALQANGQTFAGFSSVDGTESGTYYFSAQINIGGDTQDSNFGLLFQVVDGANYYLFQILPAAGQWRYLVLDDGQWIDRLGWQDDARLKGISGEHTVAVWAIEQVYFFLWDGQFLGHVQESTHLLGGVGLFAETAPEAAGNPLYIWDNVRVGVPTETWARPFISAAGVLTADSSLGFNVERAVQVLQTDLVGTWHWNNETNTQTMDWIFAEDGTYQQTLWASDMEEAQAQNGRWYIVDDVTLVLESEGLPDQRYQPNLDDTKFFLTVPELNDRIFVRLE